MSKFVLLAALLLPVSPLPVKGEQPLVGLIEGTVKNQQQAPLPYATVTVTNIDSVEPESHRRAMVADQHGFYQFIEVPEGRYSIVVTMKGYRDYTIPLVKVRGGETVKAPDIKMSPATSANKK